MPKIKDNRSKFKFYRSVIAKLNKKLDTVETNMCLKRWKTIDFKNVPSISMNKYTKPFLDEKNPTYLKNGNIIKKQSYATQNSERKHNETNDDYDDRNTCRNNLLEHTKNTHITKFTENVEPKEIIHDDIKMDFFNETLKHEMFDKFNKLFEEYEFL